MATPNSHGFRTHTNGELREAHAGQTVTLKGWVDTRRDLGGMVFADLRDRYGLTQVVFSPQASEAAYERAHRLKMEDVVSVTGTVKQRESPNPDLPTGLVEVWVDSLEVLAEAEPLPFVVSAHEERQQKANEDLRLKYRYLDLRRPHLQQNLLLRHRVYQSVRRYFDRHDFVEVETPVLMKSTPEGARDYLVPSRVHPGKFYALPQSPQTYKQILMIAGLDRYFQIVKCFRDEDLRADRQPEFTQIDVELTFAKEELVYDLFEGLMKAVWEDVKGEAIETPFPRLPYHEAIRRYGSDKPDLRFGMEIHDLSNIFRDAPFRVFSGTIAEGGAVVGIRVPGEGDRGRGQMDRLEKDVVKGRIGAGGLTHFRLPSDGSDVQASIKETILPREFVDRAVEQVGAEAGDLVLVLVGPQPAVFEQMGALRLHMGEELGLATNDGTGPWRFLWVTDFPLLEHDAEADRYFAMHHPFTSPKPEDLDKLETDPGAVRARAYDLVLNGSELGGGSIRIHRRDVQQQMFRALGIDAEEAQARFGFLLDAFRYGAPPHGGIAFGLDRIVMHLAGAASLRDVIAFPKTQAATEPMSGTPAAVDADQLQELHIRAELPEGAEPVEKTKAVREPS
ncbi:MAG: aspartate--tRNA ligase [Rhodothermales bacterium]|nr:aspartate--tRNA ligase [Rhodothermales bacterium]